MVVIRTTNEIILNLLDFFRLVQPDLDTKPGTVARDILIDAPASQLSLIYNEVSNVANQQSLRLLAGSNLDKFGKNFGLSRNKATPSSGIALLTFGSINSTIPINKGDIVIAINGFSFSINSGVSILPSSINLYKSIASKYRNELDLAGISDQYAITVTVTATSAGTAGNIGKYALNRTPIGNVSNVTNVTAFSGGTDNENDAIFRDRILSVFSGSSVGTALGYLNVALGTTGVQDATIISPGDPLMTRDGTITTTSSGGTISVISEGSGGKVDVAILGNKLVQNTDTYIYTDKSNTGNASDNKNDIILGQIPADINKTINKKRIDDIQTGILPAQPVYSILSLTGSLSGSNFVEKSVDSFGRVSGNFELLKDTGVYSGSVWGFDKLHFISNKISGFEEDRIKGQFNGQDNVTFTDVLEIPKVKQNISVTNENSIVTSDRSLIQLLHTPVTNVTRIFNVNTGERYVISNQNPDGTGTLNLTGRIKIIGNTLPSPSDILQVDYNWSITYDQYSDYDGRKYTNNPRKVTDSVDWGYSSIVKNEKVKFTKNIAGTFFFGTSTMPISSVISANIFTEADAVVYKVNSGVNVNRLAIDIINLQVPTTGIDSIVLKNTNVEVYNTDQNNYTQNFGSFISSAIVVGINILYKTTVIFPTDTQAKVGDTVTSILNPADTYSVNNVNGSVTGNKITIPAANLPNVSSINLLTTYVANIQDLFTSPVTNIPSSRLGNGFILNNNNGFTNNSIVNLAKTENQSIQLNLSNQLFIDLNCNTTDYTLTADKIFSVIRIADGVELWNSNNQGTVINGTTGNYQLILNTFNTPKQGDFVLIIYYPLDNKRFQPFTFENKLINYRLDNIKRVPSLTTVFNYYVNINNFTPKSGLKFSLQNPNDSGTEVSVTDGYLSVNISNNAQALLSSVSFNFATLPDLLLRKIVISDLNNPANNGTYDIISYNSNTNNLTITNVLDKIDYNQISVIRVADGKDIWNSNCTFDIINNRLVFPKSTSFIEGDRVLVYFFKYKTLKKSSTKLICTTTDQVINTGTVTVLGTTLNKATDIIFTATNTGLQLNINEAVRKTLGLNSNATIPSNIKLIKIAKLEKVTTVSLSSDQVFSVLTTYDLKNTVIKNNTLFNENFIKNNLLGDLDFVLPNTTNNSLTLPVNNIPSLGDKLRITFYYSIDGDTESLGYTSNGTLYTNKQFALINNIFVSSGFKSSLSTKLAIRSFNQPSLGARYKTTYDYVAPKQNERISAIYNYNKLVGDVTFNIEKKRPINADVLARAANLTKLDLTINIVITDALKNSSATVIQNVKDKMISTLTTTKLGGIVDSPTIINAAQSINGVARARIIYFNVSGTPGQITSKQAQANEYFISNNIIVNIETR